MSNTVLSTFHKSSEINITYILQMKKLSLQKIKYLVPGHIARMCHCYTRSDMCKPKILIHHMPVCLMKPLHACQQYFLLGEASLTLSSPLVHYFWVSLALSDACSWDPGLTSRTISSRARKLPFQGLLAHHHGVKWEALKKTVSSRGGEWMRLFW